MEKEFERYDARTRLSDPIRVGDLPRLAELIELGLAADRSAEPAAATRDHPKFRQLVRAFRQTYRREEKEFRETQKLGAAQERHRQQVHAKALELQALPSNRGLRVYTAVDYLGRRRLHRVVAARTVAEASRYLALRRGEVVRGTITPLEVVAAFQHGPHVLVLEQNGRWEPLSSRSSLPRSAKST